MGRSTEQLDQVCATYMYVDMYIPRTLRCTHARLRKWKDVIGCLDKGRHYLRV